jgi:branched-chain amino acid transport system ATP-binding protein
MTDMADSILELKDVCSGYDNNEVLHGVSLRVEHGKSTALLGANGAGKTTLLRTISGILAPKSGEVLFEGESIGGMMSRSIVERGLVQVPEGRRVFRNLTVFENLRVAATFQRKHFDESLQRIYVAFPILKERSAQHAGLLSGGEQQMLALGRAIVARPKLLLLDEMSLGLAPILIKQFYGTLNTLFGSEISFLVVEQNARMAFAATRYVYVLRNGMVVDEGDVALFSSDVARLTRAYLGNS